MTIFDLFDFPNPAKAVAYGKKFTPVKGTAIDSGQVFRLERARPFYRAGVQVFAVPQFRAVNLFSPTSKNALLPTISVTPTQIAYPVKVK